MVRPVVAVVLVGFAFVGLPFVLVGAAFVRRGRRRLAERVTLRGTPLRTVTDVQAGQRAKLAGQAMAADAPDDETGVWGDTETPPGTFPAAFSGVPALAARYAITEYRPDGDGGRDKHRIHDERRVVPFQFIDETGSVAVDPVPDVVEFSDEHREFVRVDEGEEPSDRIKRYVAATSELDPATKGIALGPFNFGGRQRGYVEWTIRPDDDLLLAGPVERDPHAPWGESLTVEPTGKGDVVTNRSLDEQDTYSAVVALGYLLTGTALVLGPLSVLGYMLWEMGVF